MSNINSHLERNNLSPSTRVFIFLLVCTPLRILIAWFPLCFKLNNIYLSLYTFFIFLIGFIFSILYSCELRLNAPEGGGVTWWHSHRIVHSIFFLLSSFILSLNLYYNIYNIPRDNITKYFNLYTSSTLLSIDIIYGLILVCKNEILPL